MRTCSQILNLMSVFAYWFRLKSGEHPTVYNSFRLRSCDMFYIVQLISPQILRNLLQCTTHSPQILRTFPQCTTHFASDPAKLPTAYNSRRLRTCEIPAVGSQDRNIRWHYVVVGPTPRMETTMGVRETHGGAEGPQTDQ